MSTPSERHLAQELSRLSQRLDRLEQGSRPTQLGHSSIENDNVRTYDSAGSVRQITGKQSDDTFAVTYENGDTPDTPSAPTVSNSQLSLVVYWDGTFATGMPRRKDVQRIDVHASTTSGFTPDGTTIVGSLFGEGGLSFTADLVTRYIVLVAVTNADVRSAASGEVSGTALAASEIAAGTITSNEIASGAITADKLAAQIILTSELISQGDNASITFTPNGSIEVIDDDAGNGMFIEVSGNHPAIYWTDTTGTLAAIIRFDLANDTIEYVNASGIHMFQGDDNLIMHSDPLTYTGDGVVLEGSSNILQYWTYTGPNSGDGAPEDWQPLNLQNGWQQRSGRYQPAAKLMPDGTVMLRGGADSGDDTNGTIIATLPDSRMIPSSTVLLPLPTNNGYTIAAEIDTSGNVSVVTVETFTTWHGDGVVYSIV